MGVLEPIPIEELLLALLHSRLAGNREIRVPTFPTRMNAEGMAFLQREDFPPGGGSISSATFGRIAWLSSERAR